MCNDCAILAGSDNLIGVRDDNGCVLKIGHHGPHEFVDRYGIHWQWETDLECDCEHCMSLDGDYCIVYWQKSK